jgi:hypothetical protein
MIGLSVIIVLFRRRRAWLQRQNQAHDEHGYRAAKIDRFIPQISEFMPHIYAK